jgi:VWFA-related protein
VRGIAIGPEAPAPVAIEPVTRSAIPVPDAGDATHRGRRLLVFYFDLTSLPFLDRIRALDGADAYISRRMAAGDMIAVMAWDGQRVQSRQPFTDDRMALRSLLAQLAVNADDAQVDSIGGDDGSPAFGEDGGAFNLFGTDRRLTALQTAVTDLGSITQAKTVIYFGSGLGSSGLENLAQLRATVNAAVRAGVTLNPIDARGLVAMPPMGDASRPSPGGAGMFSGASAGRLTSSIDGSRDLLHAVARDTGGVAIVDNNDLGLGVAHAAAEGTGYYLLGYYTTNAATDGKYRRVKVALAGRIAGELTYREGYYGAKDYARFNAAEKEQQLAQALAFEDPLTEIGLLHPHGGRAAFRSESVLIVR